MPERMWAVPGCPWIRTILARYLPECGKWTCIPGANSVAVRAAAFTFHTMAERNGLASRNRLPHAPLGKIDVAVAPTNSNRVYALIQTKDQGSVWRSDDGGVQWKAVNYQRALIGRAGYYIRLAVSPAATTKSSWPTVRSFNRWTPARIFKKSAGEETHTIFGSIPQSRSICHYR